MKMTMGEWKTIDSAPKDGTSILLWCPYADKSGTIVVGEFWVRAWASSDWKIDYSTMVILDAPDPTHWMPLPEPPEADQPEVRE